MLKADLGFSGARRILAGAAAATVAGIVFTLDLLTPLQAAVAVLYLLAPVIGSRGGGRAAIYSWSIGCAALAITAFILTHGRTASLEAALRLIFSLVALGVTCALLVSRRGLNEAHAALEAMAVERARELERSQGRFRTLFSDLHIAAAEQDIRQAKIMVDELKASGVTNFQAFAEANPEWINKAIAAVTVLDVNDSLIRMMGYRDRAELVAKPPSENAVDGVRVMTQQLEAIFNGERHFTVSTVLVGKGDIRVPVFVGINYDPEWRSCLSTHVDMTDQRRTQDMLLTAREELSRANRVATLGALSTSLAHELNQPIQALAVDTRTCLRWLAADPPAIDQATRILDRLSRNAERMKGIVRRTRDSLANRRAQSEAVDLSALVSDTLALLDRDLGNRGAQAEVQVAPGLPLVMTDRIEAQQVLVNLVVNAAEAMAEARSPRRVIMLTLKQAGEDEVRVDVQDTGPGISEGNRARLFEPFFTTKANGVGMGLQICRSLVEAHGGQLTLDAPEEGGARFSFTVPVAH